MTGPSGRPEAAPCPSRKVAGVPLDPRPAHSPTPDVGVGPTGTDTPPHLAEEGLFCVVARPRVAAAVATPVGLASPARLAETQATTPSGHRVSGVGTAPVGDGAGRAVDPAKPPRSPVRLAATGRPPGKTAPPATPAVPDETAPARPLAPCPRPFAGRVARRPGVALSAPYANTRATGVAPRPPPAVTASQAGTRPARVGLGDVEAGAVGDVDLAPPETGAGLTSPVPDSLVEVARRPDRAVRPRPTPVVGDVVDGDPVEVDRPRGTSVVEGRATPGRRLA